MTTFRGRQSFDERKKKKNIQKNAWQAKAMAKNIETHIYAHTGVDELEEAKIESELNYEHYKVPSRSS